jgi:hypothetical protein
MNNVFNTFAGFTASPSNAVALARRNAPPLATIAVPLPPRAVFLTYTLSGGAPLPTNVAAPPDEDVSSEIDLAPTPFGQPAGIGYLQLDKTNSNCFVNEARVAERVLRAIDDAVTYVKLQRQAHGSAVGVALAESPDVTLAYRPLGDSFAITVKAATVPALRALAYCAYIHNGTRDEEAALGLYVPVRDENVDFVYMNSVGLYTPIFLRGGNGKKPGMEIERFRGLPTTPPAEPFKIVLRPSCTAAIRPAAEAYLIALAAFAIAPAGSIAPSADGWVFTRHAGVRGRWIETTAKDAALRAAVVQCASVAGGTIEELVAAVADSAPFPAINYSDKLGLYSRVP